MTSNLPLDQIHVLLNRANTKDPNIRITPSIGLNVEFLDVLLENNDGQLQTSVFHKPAAEPYIVPFLSDHPRHVHRNTIKGALFRAVRLCSNVKDFDKERLNIELTLLLNGYPPRFISYHFKRFFEQSNAISLIEQLDNDTYSKLHQKLIVQPTRRERTQNTTILEQNVHLSNEIQQQQWSKKEIHVYYTYQSGPMSTFKHEIRSLWKKYYIYQGSSMNNTTLKINTSTSKSLHHLLVKKKPTRSKLVDKITATSK
jgi:hypothetical protein